MNNTFVIPFQTIHFWRGFPYYQQIDKLVCYPTFFPDLDPVKNAAHLMGRDVAAAVSFYKNHDGRWL